jgi:hypothetical protein
MVVEYNRQGNARVMLANQMNVIVMRDDFFDILGWRGWTIARYLKT